MSELDDITASVIVPCGRGGATLEPCLRSLLDQQVDFPYEIIVVENLSPDDSLAVASRIAAQSGGRLRVSREPRPGSYAARNHGVSQARGTFLLFTDADCRVERSWAASLVAALRDPGHLIVGGAVVAEPEQRSLLGRYAASQGILDQRQTLSHPLAPFLQTANLGVRRADLLAVGGFDGSLRGGGDADLCWRLQRLRPEGRIRLIDGATAYHTHRESVGTLFNQFRRYGRSDVVLSRRFGRSKGAAALKLGADVLRIVGLPARVIANLPRAARQGDLLPVATPALRVVQLLGRRAGQLDGALDRQGSRSRP